MESTHLKSEVVKDQLSDVTSSSPTSLGATGMRRDHESIDDFEHLEPESSPVKETAAVLIDKLISMDKEPIVGSGKDILTSIAKTAESQNSSDFSLLSDSKLDSPPTENITPDLIEESFPSSSTKLIDITNAFKTDDKNLPDLSVIGKKPASFQSEFLSEMSKEHSPKHEVETIPEKLIFAGTDFVTHLETKLDTKLSDPKALAQSFMATEREGLLAEVDIPTGDTFSDDIEFLKFESKASEPGLDIGKSVFEKDIRSSGEPDPSLSLAHIRDDLHDDDSFKDTDSIPEVVKAGEKLIDNLPEDSKFYKSASDGNDDDYEDEEYDIPVVQDSSPKLSDKLDQYQTKLPHEQRNKPTESESEPEPEDDEIHAPVGIKLQEPSLPIAPTISESIIKSPSPVSEASVKPTPSAPEPDVEPAQVSTESRHSAAEETASLFSTVGLDAWFQPERLHPKVVELVYWRDPKKSGAIFGSVLGVLLSLSYFSLISVVAYLSLAALIGTIAYRIYKNVMQALQKTTEGHPFKEILELDLTLPQDKVREVTDVAVAHLNAAAAELRRLFLVEDLVDSIKFGILLWCLTYVGSWFNGMTLIIIAFVALFTLPKVYENNKSQIDQNLDLVRSKLADITAKVKTFNPISKKAPAEEVKKEQ